jgi:hypothetical protein
VTVWGQMFHFWDFSQNTLGPLTVLKDGGLLLSPKSENKKIMKILDAIQTP